MTGRASSGIRRRVFFQGWCALCLGWEGPERDVRWMAEMDLASHRTNRHPSERVGELA